MSIIIPIKYGREGEEMKVERTEDNADYIFTINWELSANRGEEQYRAQRQSLRLLPGPTQRVIYHMHRIEANGNLNEKRIQARIEYPSNNMTGRPIGPVIKVGLENPSYAGRIIAIEKGEERTAHVPVTTTPTSTEERGPTGQGGGKRKKRKYRKRKTRKSKKRKKRKRKTKKKRRKHNKK